MPGRFSTMAVSSREITYFARIPSSAMRSATSRGEAVETSVRRTSQTVKIEASRASLGSAKPFVADLLSTVRPGKSLPVSAVVIVRDVVVGKTGQLGGTTQ